MEDILLTLAIMLVLLLLQGFFSGSEIALVNADKLKLKHRAQQGDNGAKLVLKKFEKPERLLATTLVGTNIATVSMATLATLTAFEQIGEGGDLIAILLITPLMLIFGEVVPKSVYQQKSDELAPIIIYPLQFFSWVLFPVILFFSTLARLVAHLVGEKQSGVDLFVSREKLRTLLESAEQAPASDIFDHQRIRHALKFSDLTAIDVMIPLSDAVIMNSDHTLQQAVELVTKTGYNRIPVYDTEASRIIGVFVTSTWDLLDPEVELRSITDFLYPARFVAQTQPAEQLMPSLQRREDHMAIVVDEFGSAIGLLTVEDIIEEVVGDIEDIDFRLHKHHRNLVQEIDKDCYLVDAHLPISELNDLLNENISTLEFRTVGGLLSSQLQKIPEPGEFVVKNGFSFTAIECDERMVRTVRIDPEGD